MVAILLGTGFEESEALVPADLLRRAGIEVRLVGVDGPAVTSAHGVTVTADLTLAELADGKGEPLEDASDVKPVPERMLVFCGLNQVLLAQVLEVIRLAKLPPIPMKAVLTMNNLQWNTMQLYEELCREREAMEAQKNGQAPAEAKADEAKPEESAEAPKAEEVKAEEAKTEEPTAEEKPEEKA